MRILPISVIALALLAGGTVLYFVSYEGTDELESQEHVQLNVSETPELVPVDWFIVTTQYNPSIRDPVTYTGLLGHYRCTLHGTGMFDECGFRVNSSVERIEFEFEWSDEMYDGILDSKFGVYHSRSDETFQPNEDGELSVTRDDTDGYLTGHWQLVAGPAGAYEAFYTAMQATVWAPYNVTEPAPEWVVGTYETSPTASWCSNACSFEWSDEEGNAVVHMPDSDALELVLENSDTGDEIVFTERGISQVTPGEWIVTPRTTEPVLDPAQTQTDLWVLYATQ